MSWKMKATLICGALLAAGCGREAAETAAEAPPEAMTEAAPTELTEWCRVCEVDKGEKLPEYLPSRLDVVRDGQTNRFCNDGCRAKFDANPKPYLDAEDAAPEPEPSGAVDAADGAD